MSIPSQHGPHPSIGWVPLIVACVVFAGTCTADNCDQACREREYFYICPAPGTTSNYFEMEEPDCFYCTKPAGQVGGGACSKTNPAIGGTCGIAGTNRRRTYTSENQLCLCQITPTPTIWFIEATYQGPAESWVNDTLYQCPR